MNSNVLSKQSVLTLQSKVLNGKKCLYDLFDKIQTKAPFSIPQNSIVINLDNITFGPDKYTIVVSQNQQQTFRIVYYSILFYIFEKNPENKGNHIYQKILHFIFTHDLCLLTPQFTLSDEQVKAYLVKFLHLLQKQKSKHKLIVQQLSNLPPMDILFNHLIRKITSQEEVIIQLNATQIQSAFKKQMDFTFQFLTNETFIFQNSYVVDIRYFDQSCEFYIRNQTQEKIKLIREQILLAQSAHFNNQPTDLSNDLNRNRMFNKAKTSVIKKSTVKSIGWIDQQEQPEQTPKEIPTQHGVLETSCTLNEQQTFQNDSSKEALKQTLESSDGQGFNNIFLNNASFFNLKEQKNIIFGKSHFEYKQKRQPEIEMQSNPSIESLTFLRTEIDQLNKSSLTNFNWSKNQNFKKKNPKLHTQQSQTDSVTKFPGTLSVSNSIQHIQAEKIVQNNSFQKREIRIPRFVSERERARKLVGYQQNRNSFSNSIKLVTIPKITFTYRNR